MEDIPTPQGSATRCPHDVTVRFITLGCPKNEVDSNRMATLLSRAGFSVTEEDEPADVVVVNTCSFITEATEEAVDTIFETLFDEGFAARGSKLIVAGCMPSRYGEGLSESLPEAAAFLPVDEEDGIISLVSRLCDVDTSGIVERLCGADDPRMSLSQAAFASGKALRTAQGLTAYVKISDGCDRYCSYCTIPFIRGRYHSRHRNEIEAEVDLLVGEGVREIILVGQDTSVWGDDLDGEGHLPDLVDGLATRHPDTWFRLMYLQPERLDERLIDVFAAHDNVCDYLDIPLQHCNADILHDMNRQGCGEQFLAIIAYMRKRIPGIRIRTTLIAGFPGETEEQAEELGGFLREAQFDYAGVFAYSQEEGTRAGRREDQVPEEVRQERAQRLRDIGDEVGFARCAQHVGEIVPVLVEGYDDDGDTIELIGRTQGQAPEIDGMVHLPEGSAEVGQVVDVRLVDSFCYEYEGEVVDDSEQPG